MYGIVNKAIENLVKENFGADKWECVKRRSEIEIDYFISNEPYDDAVTYKLATAVSEEMNIPLADVLFVFGEYWVLKTGREKYGSMMEAGGNNLWEFLFNLPQFHNRIMLIYPKLTPPEFKVVSTDEGSLLVNYYSSREGLQDFVRGLLSGLGKMYATPISIELTKTRKEGYDHETFKVTRL